MTLDCFILRSSSFFTNSDHPQSRVISVHSWYLTSFNLSFCRFDLALSLRLLPFLLLIHFDLFRSYLYGSFASLSLVSWKPSGFTFRSFPCLFSDSFLFSDLLGFWFPPFLFGGLPCRFRFSLQVLLDFEIPVSFRFLPLRSGFHPWLCSFLFSGFCLIQVFLPVHWSHPSCFLAIL